MIGFGPKEYFKEYDENGKLKTDNMGNGELNTNLDLKTKIDLLRIMYNIKRIKTHGDIAGHLPFLYRIASTLKPNIIIHSGVRDGNSCAAFALAQLENGGKLIDIDENKNSDEDLVKIRDNTENWTMEQTKVENEDLLMKLQEYKGSVDMWISDTCHSYSGTMLELKEYSKLLSPKGIFFIHDMDPWTVYREQSRAVDIWLKDNPEWKVKVQKGNNGIAVFYRDEFHLCGIKCDGHVGDEYPWGQDVEKIIEELKILEEKGIATLLSKKANGQLREIYKRQK